MNGIKSKLNRLVSFALASVWAIPVGVTIIGMIIIFIAALYYGKYHNPIEKEVSKVIQKETGVNVDSILPDDE